MEVEPLIGCSYEDFPPSVAVAQKMTVLPSDFQTRGVFYQKDIEYCRRSGMPLTLQLLRPTQEGVWPLIVYVQGSAWMEQDVYWNLPNLSAFSRRGFVIASVRYRPSMVAPFPAQLRDVKTAIRFLRKYAAEFAIDPENVSVWGDSSGGHTALLVGMTKDMPELDTPEYGEFSASVSRVVDYYGPTHLQKMAEAVSAMEHRTADSPEGLVLGGKIVASVPEQVEKAAPLRYASIPGQVPISIFHGNKDRLVPFEQSCLLADALEAAGNPYVFYQLKNADHGGPAFWSERVLDIVENFLRV